MQNRLTTDRQRTRKIVRRDPCGLRHDCAFVARAIAPLKIAATCRHSLAVAVAALLIFFAIPLSVRAFTTSPELQFEAQMANSRMLSAANPAGCDRAARALAKLIRHGARNRSLFYNYGTMLLAAGHPHEAYHALIRAERYSGTTWEIRHNMLVALAKIEKGPVAPRLPWYRIPLFWHYGLAARTRMTIASLAFLGLCLAILLRHLHRPEPYRFLLVLSSATLVLFGSSALTTIYQESHADVLVDDTISLPHKVPTSSSREEQP